MAKVGKSPNVEVTIKVEIGGQVFDMSESEARDLWSRLSQIFGAKQDLHYPPGVRGYQPWSSAPVSLDSPPRVP